MSEIIAGYCSAVHYCQSRTDLPRYNVFSKGRKVDDPLDLGGFEKNWEDKVSFYTGCSYTFESALKSNGMPLRNMDLGLNVSVYLTNIMMKEVGAFSATEMVVSMRPIKQHQLAEAFLVCSQYPKSHGAPIHIGNPARIGVMDITTIYAGDPSTFEEDEVPVFWACGVSNRKVVEDIGRCVQS